MKKSWRILWAGASYGPRNMVFLLVYISVLIPVAAQSKAWVCSCSLDGIADLNPARDVNVCLLSVLCIVR